MQFVEYYLGPGVGFPIPCTTRPLGMEGVSMKNVTALILAAGHGTRMKSGLLKVLHPVAGRPMVEHVVNATRQTGILDIVVVVGFQKEKVQELLGDRVRYAYQEQQLGTGHAVLQAQDLISGSSETLVLYGDTPLLTPDVLQLIVNSHRAKNAAATVLSFDTADPGGYGRIIRDAAGDFIGIREEADLNEDQKAIREVNSGICCFKTGPLLECLPRLRNNNAQREYYLVDVFDLLRSKNLSVLAVKTSEAESVIGVNDRKQLAQAESILRERILNRLMESGVTILDPATTFISDQAEIGPDTEILPFTVIEGKVSIGSRCRIGPGVNLKDCFVEDGAEIYFSVVKESRIGKSVQVGPYAHIRPESELAEGVRVGNFAEVKKSRVGAGSKIPHHSYVGDSIIGAGVNIGAGVVTVNYDGIKKHVTTIDDKAFVGCNANLIAPIHLGEGAYVAAGSTINKDVPSMALGIARARQENKEGWVERRTPRNEKPENPEKAADGEREV